MLDDFAAAKAKRLADESRRKQELEALEAQVRQGRDKIKTIKAEAPPRSEGMDRAREALWMVQASSKSSTSDIPKSSAPFDSLLKFERPPANITEIMSELKGREVEPKVTAQRVPRPDPFSELSSWSAGSSESALSKSFGKGEIRVFVAPP